MDVPLNHSFLDGFSIINIINQPFWGIFMYGNTHVYCKYAAQFSDPKMEQ